MVMGIFRSGGPRRWIGEIFFNVKKIRRKGSKYNLSRKFRMEW